MRIEEVTAENVTAACRLTVAPQQEAYVAPVAVSLAEAYANQETAWPRLLYDGQQLVAFVMAGFDPDSPLDFFRCGIWRLNVAADQQRRGYGRYAVSVVAAEARRRGQGRLTVLWVPGEHGPEQFYRRLGFRPTGEVFHGQHVGELSLPDQAGGVGSVTDRTL
ncbi:GNAT family N-acetyltransferase [Natronosporangium hydrolyticum]|uniref:GNAT family N-acetyltransferase n=1 Tax=Natronosporangium hydrolyticum TaxID=2811111 RepID=A0A895YPG9_9ACTN|nr:GNAT family N-acetyltransferase [Natronosporangium hydrolyticum]